MCYYTVKINISNIQSIRTFAKETVLDLYIEYKFKMYLPGYNS